MSGLLEFLAMGGYGGYVWSAYAITAAVLAGNVVMARRDERAALAQLARRTRGQSSHDDATP